MFVVSFFFFFQAEDGIRDRSPSRGLGDVYKRQFQNRTVGLMENGTWAPMAAKLMRAELESMKNITLCENVVTIRSAANAAAEAQMDALAAELVAK